MKDSYVSKCPYCGGRMVAEFIGNYGDAMFIKKDGTVSRQRARRFMYEHNGDFPMVYCWNCRMQPPEEFKKLMSEF